MIHKNLDEWILQNHSQLLEMKMPQFLKASLSPKCFTQVDLMNPSQTGDASAYPAYRKGRGLVSLPLQSAQSPNQYPVCVHTLMLPHTCVHMRVYKQPSDLNVKKP